MFYVLRTEVKVAFINTFHNVVVTLREVDFYKVVLYMWLYVIIMHCIFYEVGKECNMAQYHSMCSCTSLNTIACVPLQPSIP